jgi:PAS domain S-box-containing protein
MIELLPDAVLRLDADRRIVLANQAVERLTGHRADDLLGQPCAEALEPRGRDGHPVLDGAWHRSATLRSVRLLPEQEVTVRRVDGVDLRTYVTGSYERDADGGLTGAMLVLRAAGERQHQASSGIEIVSTVSHELRSPLTSVKGYTSLLLNRWERLNDDQKKMMLEQVNHDADRVTRLITELLDISRLETGRLVLRRQLVDLGDLASSIIDKVKMEYPDLDVELSMPDAFPRVYADPDKLEQVITNLVENACKYASTQGMKVVGELGGDEVAMAVSDQGEGIPDSDLPKVFTKFFRRDLGKPTGTGLGLFISRGLVEAHGGRLVATSVLGEGTTFRFTLPLLDLDEAIQS